MVFFSARHAGLELLEFLLQLRKHTGAARLTTEALALHFLQLDLVLDSLQSVGPRGLRFQYLLTGILVPEFFVLALVTSARRRVRCEQLSVHLF